MSRRTGTFWSISSCDDAETWVSPIRFSLRTVASISRRRSRTSASNCSKWRAAGWCRWRRRRRRRRRFACRIKAAGICHFSQEHDGGALSSSRPTGFFSERRSKRTVWCAVFHIPQAPCGIAASNISGNRARRAQVPSSCFLKERKYCISQLCLLIAVLLKKAFTNRSYPLPLNHPSLSQLSGMLFSHESIEEICECLT